MDLYNKATTTPIFRGNIAQTSRVHSTVARHWDFRNANKKLKLQEVPIKTLKMQGNANKTLKMWGKMTPILWRRQSMLWRLWRCRNMPPRILTLHEHAHRGEMMQHWLRIYNLSSFRRKLTSFRFQRYDVKRHHSEGKWCGSNFRAMKWHNLEERWCSLDLQGTRRCP